jgi:hypothetical protein
MRLLKLMADLASPKLCLLSLHEQNESLLRSECLETPRWMMPYWPSRENYQPPKFLTSMCIRTLCKEIQ